MRTIKELLKEKTIYFTFSSNAICYRFLSDAQLEGLTFGEQDEPCTKQATDMLALVPKGYLCFAGWASRLRYKQGGNTVIRIDYEKYINGSDDYVIKP